MRGHLVALMLLSSSLALACEWDRDTLAEEAVYGKDFVATIVGRFPRNPRLFYEMRRDRLLAKAQKATGEYDDLAVAYDKLGDPVSALAWIERKPNGSADDRYHTLANGGTFRIHAWLLGKLDRSAAQRGLEELEAAVRLNPNAHFGRERVQIELVRELLSPSGHMEPDSDPFKAAQGYAGIVRLGAGWESPDVFPGLGGRSRQRPR